MMRKILPALAVPLLIVFVVITGCVFRFYTSTGTKRWDLDLSAPSELNAELAERQWPIQLTRILERGYSNLANGNGRQLKVYCFSTDQLNLAKKLFADGGTWFNGPPKTRGWESILSEKVPRELAIPEGEPRGPFIHIDRDDNSITVIDTGNGIYYFFETNT